MTRHRTGYRLLHWFSLLCFSLGSTLAAAQGEQQTTFATQQPYADDQQITKTLQIPGAEELVIKVQGVTEECCDYLRIFDSSGRQVREFRGTIREQLFVKGSAIRIFFFSDGRTTAQGVNVTIEERSLASIFQEIKTELLNAARIIMETGTQPAFNKVNTQLAQLKNLYTEATRASEINVIIMRVTMQIQAIARVYRDIASNRLTVLQQHQQQFERITRLQKETDFRIKKLEQNKNRYLNLLSEAQQKLANIKDGIEKQKLQFSIEGYKSIAQSMHIQQSIWESFYRAQQEIEQLLQTHSGKIEVLFYLLDINAKIYEQVANTASLRQSTMINLNEMIDQTEFQRVIQAIAENEKTLQSWVTRIEQTNFQ